MWTIYPQYHFEPQFNDILSQNHSVQVQPPTSRFDHKSQHAWTSQSSHCGILMDRPFWNLIWRLLQHCYCLGSFDVPYWWWCILFIKSWKKLWAWKHICMLCSYSYWQYVWMANIHPSCWFYMHCNVVETLKKLENIGKETNSNGFVLHTAKKQLLVNVETWSIYSCLARIIFTAFRMLNLESWTNL